MSAHAGSALSRRYHRSETDRASPASTQQPRLDAWVDEDQTVAAEWRASALPAGVWDQVLLDPIRDILGRPGKSFRANLVRASWALVDDRRLPPAELPAALEILHAGSLMIDDIADDSVERRGKPCVHRIFGTPRALNAGNYMYFWALELLAEIEMPATASHAVMRRANRTMLDCHRGQALDVGLCVGGVPQEELVHAATEISALKTGALMSLAAFAGAAAAGGTREQVEAAGRFGMRLGVVLQQLDDLGNLTSKHAPGKRFEDLRAARVTWPWAWASQTLSAGAFSELESRSVEIQRAQEAPSGAGMSAPPPVRVPESVLASLADDLSMCAGLHRRADIRSELAATLSDLRTTFGDKSVLKTLAREMERLEASYG